MLLLGSGVASRDGLCARGTIDVGPQAHDETCRRIRDRATIGERPDRYSFPGLKGAWLHVNDVAGFIGPEVLKDRQQQARCCLEDIVMGKLHGLPIGLDVWSTLQISVSLEDQHRCREQVMPANPPYLIALQTKNDAMLGYLSTSFQDHVQRREKFGYKLDDAM